MRKYMDTSDSAFQRNAFRKIREEKKEKIQANQFKSSVLRGTMTHYLKTKNDYLIDEEWVE